MYKNEYWRVRGRTKTSIEEYVEKYDTNIIYSEDSSESSILMGGGGTFESIEKYKIFIFFLGKAQDCLFSYIFPYSLYRD